MGNLPLWVWSGIIGLLIGGTLVGTVIIQISSPKPNPNPKIGVLPSVPSDSTKDSNENAIVIVRDISTDAPLGDVDLYMVTKEGVLSEKTNSLGSYKFEVPPQKLGEVYITFSKAGYKTRKNLPVNFLINPNTPKTIRLESESSSSQQSSSSGQKKSIISTVNPRVDVKPNKETYTQQELINVEYSLSGVPKKYTQWMTIAILNDL